MSSANGNGHPTGLALLWQRLRLEFLLIAEGGTARLDKDGGHTKPGSKPPPPAGHELRQLERRWRGAQSDKQRRAVCWDAIDTLRTIKLPNPDIRKYRGTDEWKMTIALDPRSVRIVARMYAVSSREVCEWREQYRTKETV